MSTCTATALPSSSRPELKERLIIAGVFAFGLATVSYIGVNIVISWKMEWGLAATLDTQGYSFGRALRFWAMVALAFMLPIGPRPRTIYARWIKPALWMVAYAAVAALVAYSAQLYYVNRVAGGFYDVRPDNPLWVTHLQKVNPTLLWGSVTISLFWIFGYFRAAGPRRLFTRMKSTAVGLASAVRTSRIRGWGWLLWGTAAGILISAFVHRITAIALAGAVLIFGLINLPRLIRQMFRSAAMLFRTLVPRRGSNNIWAVRELTLALAIFGCVAGLVLSGIFTPLRSHSLAVLIALVAGLLLATARESAASRATLWCVGFLLFAQGTEAFADDGTWSDGTVRDLYNTGGGPESFTYATDLSDSSGGPAGLGGGRGELEGNSEDDPIDTVDNIFGTDETPTDSSEPAPTRPTPPRLPVIDEPLGNPNDLNR